ncbi:MAG: ATP-binding cassette domain-containing protein [Clostridiales bacterium]|nr:ATP-binding cassette domain-containing protein [Clostridiales bacterium]
MAQIRVSNLTFSYDRHFDDIFRDVSFTLDTDWKLGFTGRNGRGKTTFLKILTGELAGYAGSVDAPVRFGYFPYPVDPEEELPFFALAETLAPDVELWRLYREMGLLGLSGDTADRPYRVLSGGERTKLMLCLLFSGEDRFLLIDEPTNHLDAAGRAAVAAYLDKKKGFILVSHDRALLDGCTDHTLSVNRQSIEIEKGSISSYLLNKERRDAYEREENARLAKEIGKLKRAAAQTAQWSDRVEASKTGVFDGNVRPDRGHVGRMAAKMMKRSKVIERRYEHKIEEKAGLLKNVEKSESLKLNPDAFYTDRLVSFLRVGFSYGGAPLLSGLSFEVRAGDRLAVTGANGSGKSTLLRLILGELTPDEGVVYKPKTLKIAYVPQDGARLTGTIGDFEAARPDLNVTLFRTVLIKTGLGREQFDKELQTYSAGQKKKVLLAAALSVSAHMYIFDELLNYMDIYARIQIETLLKNSGAAMVFVEHDRAFVQNVATGEIKL